MIHRSVLSGLLALAALALPAAASAAARSSHVIIQNQTAQRLIYVRRSVAHGEITKNPPAEIAPGGTGDLFAESNGIATGTQGYVVYRIEGVPGEAQFNWDNPFVGSNSASASAPAGYHAGQIGDKGNRTLVFFSIAPLSQPVAACNPAWLLGALGTHAEDALSAVDEGIGVFTTPLKYAGISGWVDTGCDAEATGTPVRTAQHSTDGFWTVDVRLSAMMIGTQNLSAAPRFVRIEIEPGTPAHAAAAANPPPGGVPIAFHGHVLIDTHHGAELVEVHPSDPVTVGNRPKPFGADTCAQGYVWREAFAGDHVCVPPAIRAQSAAENAQAAAHRAPGGGAFGPDTCAQGFVWREASPADHVCVPPSSRSQAAYDNAHAALRRAP